MDDLAASKLHEGDEVNREQPELTPPAAAITKLVSDATQHGARGGHLHVYHAPARTNHNDIWFGAYADPVHSGGWAWLVDSRDHGWWCQHFTDVDARPAGTRSAAICAQIRRRRLGESRVLLIREINQDRVQ